MLLKQNVNTLLIMVSEIVYKYCLIVLKEFLVLVFLVISTSYMRLQSLTNYDSILLNSNVL